MSGVKDIKSKLLSGMMVLTKGGNKYLVFRNTGMDESDITGLDVMVGINCGHVGNYGWMNLKEYEEDLICISDDYYSIQSIFAPRCASEICNFKKYKEIWNREET